LSNWRSPASFNGSLLPVRNVLRVFAVISTIGLTLAPSASAKAVGTLSRSEYQQLSALSVRTDSKDATGAKLVAACNATRSVSSFVAAVRADCSAVATLAIDLANLDPSDSKCHKDDAAHVYACVLPAYSRLSTATLSVYRAEEAVRRVGTGRGLSDACIAGLSDPADVVAVEKQMVGTTAAMVADVKQQNGKALVADSNAYSKELNAATTLSDQNSAQGISVSSCKHA
jgi:hypothetical protein